MKHLGHWSKRSSFSVPSPGFPACSQAGRMYLSQLRSGMVEPELIVDIKRIDGMKSITAEDGGFRIGAAVSGAELGEHDGVRRLWPGVVEAMELIGSAQVQGRATMAGNLCNASPAADSVPAMIAANATARIFGPSGTRDHPVSEVATSPGKTSLDQGELIGSIFLPARPKRSGDAYLRFIPRTEMDIAVVSAGVSLTLDTDETCHGCARCSRCGGADGHSGRGLGRSAGRLQARWRSARCHVCCLLGRLPPDRRQAGNRRVPHQGGRRAGKARCSDSSRPRKRRMMSKIHVSTSVNGDLVEFLCEAEDTLLDCLRDRLGLTGAKEGCGTGDCGACSVHGRRSSGLLVPDAGGRGQGPPDRDDRGCCRRGQAASAFRRSSWSTRPCNVGSARLG